MRPTSPVLPHSPDAYEYDCAKGSGYLPLPVVRIDYGEGTITAISCYKLTIRERVKILFSGRIWFEQITGASHIQPQRPSVNEPLVPVQVQGGLNG